jgi:C4-dicarboxylate-specific signal transduction histidine kinase
MAGEGSSTPGQQGTGHEGRPRFRSVKFSTDGISSRWFVGNAAVIAAATLFLLTAILLGASVVRMLDNAAKTEEAQTVLHEVSNLQDSMTRASTSARLYILSHSDAMLRDRTLAIRGVIEHLDALGVVLADDPEGSALLVQTRKNIERRLALYDQVLAGKSSGPIALGEGQRLALARINDGQMAQLRERSNDRFRHFQNLVTRDMRLSMILALVTGIASPLFGFIGIHLLRRERESQQARELQMELIHVQRLAIMGETSAMLAHEINQPLTAATNYISVARRLLDNDGADKTRPVLDRVEQQIQRAAAIVRKLRRFIEKREAERNAESPDILVEDAITLLGTIDSSINLKTEIAPNLPPLLVDRVQVQQVLVNLMRNAIEAMQSSAQHALVLSLTYAGGKTVEVALADTGPGLSTEVAERLFQPFVSTKAGGMGVGLSICQSIVSQHGGRIWAEANPEGGTIFRFTLPVAEVRAAA